MSVAHETLIFWPFNIINFILTELSIQVFWGNLLYEANFEEGGLASSLAKKI